MLPQTPLTRKRVESPLDFRAKPRIPRLRGTEAERPPD